MTTCSHCGKLRRGTDLAPANNRFYCHSLYDAYPTCYQRAVLGEREVNPLDPVAEDA